MKKIVIAIIITMLIATSFIFIFITFKKNTSTKYSHNDIENLLNKGLQSMDNISFERKNSNGTATYYYKQGKKKFIDHNSKLCSIEKDLTTYIISKERKTMVIEKGSKLEGYNVLTGSLQYDALDVERFNENLDNKDEYRYEYVYIRDEKIENKDCILVKECKYYLDNKKYVDNFLWYKDGTPVYWIDKSSGMIIGGAFMESGKNTAMPEAIISNIKYGEVTDDIFNDMENIPSDYQILVNENGKTTRIQ